MELDEKQSSFLKKRRKLVRLWPFVGTLLLFGVVVFLVWQYFKNPMPVNPYEVVSRLESGAIEYSTLMLAAVMLPLVFLMCVLLLIAVIIFTFSAVSNEKKYLKIIDSVMRRTKEPPA